MLNLSEDPIQNVIFNGIIRDIQINLENKCGRSTIILVLCGIDTMAFLNMPTGQLKVTGKYFIEWADKYIRFPCKEQITGIELYGARCGMLHQYGAESDYTRSGNHRKIYYKGEPKPEVLYNPKLSKEFVIVSLNSLVEVFIKGTEKFLPELYSDSNKAKIADERLQEMMHFYQNN